MKGYIYTDFYGYAQEYISDIKKYLGILHNNSKKNKFTYNIVNTWNKNIIKGFFDELDISYEDGGANSNLRFCLKNEVILECLADSIKSIKLIGKVLTIYLVF
ncbi:MAG: hypothetical protein PWQ43_1346 [Rikenellaceae bacterium]|nr:hypothetical protein [Rikenellaceae bacterium]